MSDTDGFYEPGWIMCMPESAGQWFDNEKRIWRDMEDGPRNQRLTHFRRKVNPKVNDPTLPGYDPRKPLKTDDSETSRLDQSQKA